MKKSIRKEYENPEYRVFANDISRGNKCLNTAVICYLYYKETLDIYFKYVDHVPNEIDVYLITSVTEISDILHTRYGNKENITVIEKDNRGRDLSGLLVSCADFFFDYEFACFVHDKKEIYDEYRKETEEWALSLWENTIGTADYIRNIYDYLTGHEEVGLLVPPEPLGERIDYWYSNNWGDNYENTVNLAKRLSVDVDIRKDISPASIGSVFWARTKALRKLFNPGWEYDDFPEEPMPKDGTISHAIERILAYVALDAGYITERAISSENASSYLAFLQPNARTVSDVLYVKEGVRNASGLKKYADSKKKVFDMINDNLTVYLYGAGKYGKYCARLLRRWGIEPAGFVVTKIELEKEIEGIRVFSLEELENELQKSGVIITPIKDSVRKEIAQQLVDRKIKRFIYW
ncbi:rhamnan synthesis F family protein [Butyrivibrio sp. MB2005]|uniref:rhamnan synthesis F family protein n=1 Tax=Butyrivibrio sp. MB2005 TaxID=1280678 RepID=UPI00047C14CB|nr:rhamnan synthesis F family protein [Butyrivibrio sp. MB2005]